MNNCIAVSPPHPFWRYQCYKPQPFDGFGGHDGFLGMDLNDILNNFLVVASDAEIRNAAS
ncbi:hypothetical protein [Candidatus Synchoanobacter obligatus]|uniref:Uncharacterized protein n=1 Tax=Candidatus Synchoanobacter obligatus TaxID=2919597 RepID=A0ABT1L4D6_9GAMM|nr:hypothetical protein [Candidatus Synchoanobacter obligatus]MCP8352032.1 hypothetical protein [Candidatus Synchoanobacter obligatus]